MIEFRTELQRNGGGVCSAVLLFSSAVVPRSADEAAATRYLHILEHTGRGLSWSGPAAAAEMDSAVGSLQTPFLTVDVDVGSGGYSKGGEGGRGPGEMPNTPSDAPSARPARLHPLYSLHLSVATALSAAYSAFVRLRWRLLLPLYRRVNLPHLHSLAVIELLCILAYLAANAYFTLPLLYRMLRPQRPLSSYMVGMVQSAYRLGAVGTWNLLAVWLPVTRHSLWNYALGMSYDRARLYHLHISRYTLLLFTLHGGGLYAWIVYKDEFWQELLQGGWTGRMATGSLAMTGGLLLLLTSLHAIRRRWWELFYRAHWLGLVVFTVFSMLHHPSVIRWQLGGVLLFCVDLLLRTYKWTQPADVVSVSTADGGDVTRIEWRASSGFEFSAGQFVLLCFPAISPLEWHPYTIASSPHHLPHVVVYSRRAGWWTQRLHELSREAPSASPVRMYVEGPYGQLSVHLPLYRHVMLVSGGMGVAPMLSVYHHLASRSGADAAAEAGGAECGAATSDVQFVWSMRDRQLIRSVWRDMELFNELRTCTLPNPYHASRAFTSMLPSHLPTSPTSPTAGDERFSRRFYLTQSSQHSQQPGEEAGETDWQTAKGRPPLARLFHDMRARMQQPDEQQADATVRCAVLVCGPDALIVRCRRLCSRYSDAPLKSGPRVCFDLHEETYEW